LQQKWKEEDGLHLGKHWIRSGHKGSCYPGKADVEKYGRQAQGKE
jgi:hypothetical protein